VRRARLALEDTTMYVSSIGTPSVGATSATIPLTLTFSNESDYDDPLRRILHGLLERDKGSGRKHKNRFPEERISMFT
jgi:hypothetical protein